MVQLTVVRPVVHHGAELAAVLEGEVHAAGAVVVVAELLAHRAHRGGVH